MDFNSDKVAKTVAVKAGDSLREIAKREDLSPARLAAFNWGSKDSSIVCRALFEEVGTATYPKDWRDFKFEGDESDRGSGKIKIPDIWLSEDKDGDAVHEYTIYSPVPATAVAIDTLDKWFVPGLPKDDGEPCRIAFSLDAPKHEVGTLDLEIYASNYCYTEGEPQSADPRKPGELAPPKMTVFDTPLPVFQKQFEKVNSQSYRAKWQGQTTIREGMLASSGEAQRYVDVAFSPYTVLLRYAEAAAEKAPRIDLADYWPQWQRESGGRKVVPESLDARWSISNCRALKYGQFCLVDRTDEVVYRRALNTDQLSEGEHEILGSDLLDAGVCVWEANAPYRLQIHARSEMGAEAPVSMAAMQTEVRLFSPVPQLSSTIQSTMSMALGDYTENEPDESDQAHWVHHKLAAGGFSPGPFTGEMSDSTTFAIAEFQRAFPVLQGDGTYGRLKVTAELDDETMAALRDLPPEYRKAFAAGKARKSLDWKDANERFSDPNNELVLWVEDRHGYTKDLSLTLDTNDPVFMGNYRWDFAPLDSSKSRMESSSICRPCVPVTATPNILKRDDSRQGLSSSRILRRKGPTDLGPLRMDWWVQDLPPDEEVVNTSDRGYQPNFVRTKRWLQVVIDELSEEGDTASFYNCQQKYGGQRPVDNDGKTDRLAYNAGLLEARGPEGLADCDQQKTRHSLTHCNYDGQRGDFDEKAAGQASVWFRSSIIAGDGYRIMAALNFVDDEHFPNASVLKRRYPEPPQSRSAGLRLWRRAATRGGIRWTGETLTEKLIDDQQDYFVGAHIDFTKPDDRRVVPRRKITDLLDDPTYKKAFQAVTHRSFSSNLARFSKDHLWPFMHKEGLGLVSGPPGVGIERAWDEILFPAYIHVIGPLQTQLTISLLKRWEKETGTLLGNLVCLYSGSPEISAEEFKCSACETVRVSILNNNGKTVEGLPCVARDCGGSYQAYTPRKQKPVGRIGYVSSAHPMGFVWQFDTHNDGILAHEIGHTRHLAHSDAAKGNSIRPDGANHLHHDTVENPRCEDQAEDHNDNWDLFCMMGYSNAGGQYFCGPCMLRLRGWKIEELSHEVPGHICDVEADPPPPPSDSQPNDLQNLV